MHLSMLTDGFLSDSIDDAGACPQVTTGRAHRDGLVRGLCFFAVMALTIGLLCGATVMRATALPALVQQAAAAAAALR